MEALQTDFFENGLKKVEKSAFNGALRHTLYTVTNEASMLASK